MRCVAAPARRAAGLVAAVLVALLMALASTHPETGSAGGVALGAATPPAGVMTIYAVTNANTAPLNLQHVLASSSGFKYSFWSQIPGGATIQYHLRDIAQVPSPFNGSVSLSASQPFTAQVVGYDFRSMTHVLNLPIIQR